MNTIEDLNTRFGIPGRLSFARGSGAFAFAHLKSPGGNAEICLHGAHVTAFVPNGQPPVIWVSPDAVYAPERAIRGGIPVCWPWFADHPENPDMPAHGVARTSQWEVTASSVVSDAVRIEFKLPAGIAAPVAPDIELKLAVTLTDSLDLELTTTNQSGTQFSLTQALHTYLHVGAIEKVSIEGLNEALYLDKVESYREVQQEGDVIVNSETDRMYQNTTADILVKDAELDRTIRVGKTGSSTTVVWNPWITKAEKMADFTNEEFHHMVCVEATNAADDVIVLDPGTRHTLGTRIAVE